MAGARQHYNADTPLELTAILSQSDSGDIAYAMGSVDLLPGNADKFGINEAWLLKRTHVCQMARGKDMHFIYATMDSTEYEDEGKTEITT